MISPAYDPRRTVLSWLRTFPGVFDAPTPQACHNKARLAASMSAISQEVFDRALYSLGYQAKEIRPGLYRLALPEKGVGVSRMT